MSDLEQSEIRKLIKCDKEGQLREHKGAIKAYHQMLTFLLYDSAGKGKDVIENAD